MNEQINESVAVDGINVPQVDATAPVDPRQADKQVSKAEVKQEGEVNASVGTDASAPVSV